MDDVAICRDGDNIGVVFGRVEVLYQEIKEL